MPRGAKSAEMTSSSSTSSSASVKRSNGGASALRKWSCARKELVASSPSQRNWRGIGIALLVILVICSLIVTAVFFLTPADAGPRVKGDKLTYADFLGADFSPHKFNGTWISDTEFAYESVTRDLLLYDATTKNSTVLVDNKPLDKFNARRWHISPDRRFLLLVSNIRKHYRYSSLAKYDIYEFDTGYVYPLLPEQADTPLLQYASWGPVGNSLVFVYKNNVFFKNNVMDQGTKQLTAVDPNGAIFNGVPDWVYEEEILSSNSALWFSQNGEYLCFASFNDTLVKLQYLEWYGTWQQPPFTYPEPSSVPYPKVGTVNPTVRLIVVNVSDISDELVEEHVVTPPDSIRSNPEYYFTAVAWANNTTLSVIWMNRKQNLSVITICPSPQWVCEEVYRETAGERGWVDLYEPPKFTRQGRRFFVRGADNIGDDGSFRQVFVRDLGVRQARPLTWLKWEVTSINMYQESTGLLYYTAAPESRPGERHLYRVATDGSRSDNTSYCMTCDIGKTCLYVNTHFSRGGSYYILECLGPDVPVVYLVESETNTRVVLDANDRIRERYATKAFPRVETFKVPLAYKRDAHVRLLLPQELRSDEITEYPLVINVYAGPGSQLVDSKFDVDWGSFLASNRTFIYGMIDGRGSGFQGEKRKFELYKRFGTVEVEDQIAVVKYLTETLQYIDERKVAIWGWSYGGYVAARVMATQKEEDVFRCGISVAPVTNWTLYDSVYTERYMGLPTEEDNKQGYLHADLLSLAPRFKSNRFYLIHGTADDNVHLQQTMLLSNALYNASVVFRAQVYPDEDHSLVGVHKHLYLSMTNFLDDCFRFTTVEKVVPEVSSKDDPE